MARSRLAPRLLVAPACIAALLSASAALAAGGTAGKVKLAAGQVGSAVSRCPAGKGIVAAGFGAGNFTPGLGGAAPVRVGSHRLGPRRLRTTGYNFGEKPGTLRGIPYCSKLGLGVRVARQKVFLPPQTPGVAIATCPPGTEAISGGFASPGFADQGPRVVALTSRREGRNAWRVEAFNLVDGSGPDPQPHAGTLVAYAYCLEHGPRILTRSRTAAAGAMGVPRKVTARCPDRTRVLSGGFDGNIYLSVDSTGSGAVASRRLGPRAWQTSSVTISDRKGAKATVYAYCVRGRR
ncbi:MAG: hypothetical protein U0R52_07480 [Solirubrobacterales bacterium]